jgi:hypothetical protein
MANSVSSRDLPEHVKRAVEKALKKANIPNPQEISREWDIMGFILREELAREGLEAVGQKTQQIAKDVGAEVGAGGAGATTALAPHPVAAFLPNKRIICGFILDPAILQR